MIMVRPFHYSLNAMGMIINIKRMDLAIIKSYSKHNTSIVRIRSGYQKSVLNVKVNAKVPLCMKTIFEAGAFGGTVHGRRWLQWR